ATPPGGHRSATRKSSSPGGPPTPTSPATPPVALMFQEGAPRLADAGVHIPGLAEGDRKRVALEAYPGLLARSIIGRVSYKNDSKLKQTADRRRARAQIVENLDLRMKKNFAETLIDDASGDSLDAVLCAIQAAGAMKKRGYGIPPGVGCEGWIISA